MVHVVVVTHGGLAQELVHTVSIIVGTQSRLDAVCLDSHEGGDDLRNKLAAIIQSETDSKGFLFLVDIFGGTPSNISLELSQRFPVHVLAGVNLPMLLEALTHRAGMDLGKLADLVWQKGRQSILDASGLLKARSAQGE